MKINKRSGNTEEFNPVKIEIAIYKCLHQIGKKDAKNLAKKFTLSIINKIKEKDISSVEDIQDLIEIHLLNVNELKAYQEFSLYRKEREVIRNLKDKIPNDVKEAYKESEQYFPSAISEFQFYDKMARFNWEKGRRETWVELVKERLVPFYIKLSNNLLSKEDYSAIEKYILQLKAEGSFRAIAMAGEAAERDNTCIYNCSFYPVDSLDAFAEGLYISMCGTGDGFSVEKYYISQLPVVKLQKGINQKIDFKDSAEGWKEGIDLAIKSLFDGKDIIPDTSKLRQKGAVLKTKGGRASGPEPLIRSLNLIREIILSAQGRQLYSDEIADIVCILGDCAIMGGVRRTAKICIVDFADPRMRKYKQGNYYERAPWRGNANISEAFVRDYSFEEIEEFVKNMDASQRGENGIFSRINAVMNAPERRIRYWERKLGYKINRKNAAKASYELGLGTNPCGEIILSTFCNLSVAVARKDLPFEELCERVRIATIIGTIQSGATYFPHLRKKWKLISDEERLLGVDIIGQADFDFLSRDQALILKDIAIQTNIEYSKILGINPSNAVTCVKPGGNSGAFFDASSGISRRKYAFSVRNIEVNIFTPTFKVLKHSKVPGFPKPGYEDNTYIFTFPKKAPEGTLLQDDDTLKSQLDYWTLIKKYYTEHNPSCSIYYKPHELPELNQWVYNNQHLIGGLTFFPNVDLSKLGFSYLPEQKITKEEYEKLSSEFPKIDWELLWIFEKEDYTSSSREYACTADKCEF